MGYRFGFIGWCRNQKHDKIWGWIAPDDVLSQPIENIGDHEVFVNFWGRRGGKLTFKRYLGAYGYGALTALTNIKQTRATDAYLEVTAEGLQRVTPDFIDQFERQLFKAKLFNQFHMERK